MTIWLEEIVDQNEKRLYKVKRYIYSEKTEYQDVLIVDLAGHGISLIIDGFARVFQSDEFIYHEALIHPICHSKSNISDVLVIGDGDGGAIRELQKYEELLRLDWVEIDQRVVEICKQHLPSFPASFEKDERIRTFWLDGADFIANSNDEYDLIFVTVTQQVKDNASEPFYTSEVLPNIHKRLKPNGSCIQSAGMIHPGNVADVVRLYTLYKREFAHAKLYNVGLPAFGINWAFIVGQDQTEAISPQRNLQEGLRFYDFAVHHQMFSYPAYLKANLFDEK
jgi:spermidine synthase